MRDKLQIYLNWHKSLLFEEQHQEIDSSNDSLLFKNLADLFSQRDLFQGGRSDDGNVFQLHQESQSIVNCNVIYMGFTLNFVSVTCNETVIFHEYAMYHVFSFCLM